EGVRTIIRTLNGARSAGTAVHRPSLPNSPLFANDCAMPSKKNSFSTYPAACTRAAALVAIGPSPGGTARTVGTSAAAHAAPWYPAKIGHAERATAKKLANRIGLLLQQGCVTNRSRPAGCRAPREGWVQGRDRSEEAPSGGRPRAMRRPPYRRNRRISLF